MGLNAIDVLVKINYILYIQGDNMTQTIEVNLVDVLNRLESKIDKLDEKIDTKFAILDQKIDTKIERLEANIDKRFAEVDKKFAEVNTRFNTLTLGFLGIIGVLTGGLLTILAKFTFFPNP